MTGPAVAKLVYIPYSPWSNRASRALTLMGIPFEPQVYTPTLSEPCLRMRLRRPLGKVTVPVLLRADGPPVVDSLDIVRWGATRSERPLIQADTEAAVTLWNTHANRVLDAGRIRTTRRVLENPEALRESLPPAIRRLGATGMAIGRDGARRLLRKYGDGRDDSELLKAMHAGLMAFREGLGAGEHLLRSLSYADITAATCLSFVTAHPSQGLGPASAQCWFEPALAAAFPDLLAWRDRILA